MIKKFEIFNKPFKKGERKYNYIIEEVYYPNCKRTQKFYLIKINGKIDLSTTLWQTWKAKIRKIEGE